MAGGESAIGRFQERIAEINATKKAQDAGPAGWSQFAALVGLADHSWPFWLGWLITTGCSEGFGQSSRAQL